MVGYWPKHPKKELEAVLEVFDLHGWVVTRRKGYYRVRCGCGLHQTSVHLSPSDPNYPRNKLAWLHRQTCTQTKEAGQ